MKAFPIPARALERAAVVLRPYLPWLHAAMALGFIALIAGPMQEGHGVIVYILDRPPIH